MADGSECSPSFAQAGGRFSCDAPPATETKLALRVLTRKLPTVNEVRAMRLAEIMQDFRNLQYYISQAQAMPTADEYNGYGYALLRQCNAEGEAVLTRPFPASQNVPAGNVEREKQHLQ